MINVGAVDRRVEMEIAQQYNVQEVPRIVFFGANKSEPQIVKASRTVGEILNYVDQ